MKNVVAFETAKRLKEAGFPQLEPETGQFWYNEFAAISIIGRRVVSEIGGGDMFYCMSIDTGRTDLLKPDFAKATFAPTATDILEQLPGYNLAFATENGWHCFFLGIDGVVYADHNHKDNPAEAAAAAWLKINENNLEV